MKCNFILFIALSAVLYSCKDNKQTLISKYLNTSALNTQTFSININRDTMLLTKSGVVIKIPKGSIESDSIFVKLDVKEAISNEDIVLAGLTTMSGKQLLSSGGMLFINPAEGYKATITNPVEALVPTKDYNPDMKIFKGTDSAGKIDWQDPAPLPNDITLKYIEAGKKLFKSVCSNCHKLTQKFSGPSLAGVTKKRTKQWLYDFIHSPAEMIARNKTARALFNEYRPVVMTAFPELNKEAIDAILAYTSTVNAKKDFSRANPASSDSTGRFIDPCADSCKIYLNALNSIETRRLDINDDEAFFTLDREINFSPSALPDPGSVIPAVPFVAEKETVIPTSVKATYYTVNITTFGWNNIDMMLKEREDCVESELNVNLLSETNSDFTVALIIPSVKLFVEGGKLTDGKQYGFDETNGKIPLPQNEQCYVIAFAETDGKLIFGQKAFTSGLKQSINIDFAETTKEGLVKQIQALKLDGLDAEVKDSEKADRMRMLDKESEAAEKLRPKNCNCGQ